MNYIPCAKHPEVPQANDVATQCDQQPILALARSYILWQKFL